jgi:hypothetical protein
MHVEEVEVGVVRLPCRFLPQDKAALAARILNQVWDAA